MDRDVLLWLLVGAVLLNTALLVVVALVRAVGAPSRAPSRDEAGWAMPAAGSVPIGGLPVAPSPVARGSVRQSRSADRPPPTPPAIPLAPVAAAGRRAGNPTMGSRLPIDIVLPVEPSSMLAGLGLPQTPTDPGPIDGPPSVTAAQPAQADVGTVPVRPAPAPVARAAARRPRRFTMPDLEEDHDRAARSIAAFLGEPVAHSGGVRAQRRRHRARRPAGATPRTDVILALAGDPRGVRIGHAVAAALRETIRESDEVVELPGNRLRVTLDADDAGRDAFVARARSVVRPWLEVVGPSLELRVEGERPLESASA